MKTDNSMVLKGTKEGLVISLIGQISFAQIKRKIVEQVSAGDAFLIGAHVTIDLGQNYLTEDQLDVLAQILGDNGLILRKIIRGATADNQVYYCDFGSQELGHRQEEMWVKDTTEEEKLNHNNDLLKENTILFQGTLRSGQSLNHPGNIVILGDVNPGGEVIAGENIVVMGNLRGIAHAGVSGNENAVVTAFRLQPTQLRIGNHITRAPDEQHVSNPQHPEIARIKNGMVVIELYQPSIERPIKSAVNKN